MEKLFAIAIFACLSGCADSSNSKQADDPPQHKVSSLFDSNLKKEPALTFDTLLNNNSIDSATIQKFKSLTREKTDEYTKITWVHSLAEPKYRNTNGLYCYFGKYDQRVENFRFVIQYYADDWLFIQTCRFLVDGKPFVYYPNQMERDNGYGGIWEWSDNIVEEHDLPLIEALANGRTAKVKFIGDKYYAERTISKKQLESIRSIYLLYRAMGGIF